MQEALTYLLFVSAALCVVLTVSTVVRKMRRDRHESVMYIRRARFRNFLVRSPVDRLASELRRARRHLSIQFDLLAALEAVWLELDDQRRALVHEGVRQARLDRALARQLQSRDAVRRASAALLVARLQLPQQEDLIAPLLADPDGASVSPRPGLWASSPPIRRRSGSSGP